jgi:prevent-host-death family protein
MTRKKKTPRVARAGVSLLMLKTREIGAADFKARCLELMDEVERLGVEIVITKHRRPVARLVPARSASGGFVGSMKGMAEVLGDIVSPTGEEWEADESNFT